MINFSGQITKKLPSRVMVIHLKTWDYRAVERKIILMTMKAMMMLMIILIFIITLIIPSFMVYDHNSRGQFFCNLPAKINA